MLSLKAQVILARGGLRHIPTGTMEADAYKILSVLFRYGRAPYRESR